MIVIIGFMGAGKSTVGELVAGLVGLPFVDTDAVVEREAGTSIAHMFDTHGEAAFRALESRTAAAALAGDEAVVAIGGGAVGDPSTARAVAEHTVVLLDVSANEALRRVGGSSGRPMLQRHDPTELLAERRAGYLEAAGVVIDTGERTPSEVADEVVRLAWKPRRVVVAAPSRRYEVVVGEDLLESAANLIPPPVSAEKCAVISHPGLSGLALAVASSYEAAGRKAIVLEVAEGEGSKSLQTAAGLHERLASEALHRTDLIAGVGGGVVTDLAGFVASTFMRGVEVVNVPTTLLGQVDAAIGGKTAVNLPAGKNLVGTFHQPAGVLCDVSVLRSLPRPELRSGLAEVAKYGFIADPHLATGLPAMAPGVISATPETLIPLVVSCAAIKARFVGADEREAGARETLNYGHTFAHAIEACASFSGIRHGEAVSLGMMIAAHLSELLGIGGDGLAGVHEEILSAAGLPVRATLDGRALEAAWQRDKKFKDGVRFVLLKALGEPVTGVRAGPETVREAIGRVSE